MNSLILFLLFLPGFLAAQPRHVYTHPAMGTDFRITISAVDTHGLAAAVRQAFKRIDALEQSMSDYRADSELNQLSGSTKWQSVSTGLYEVLRFSRQLAKQSSGAFDPTVGPLTKLWRRAFRQQQFPDREDILAARARVQWKDLKISKRRQKVRLRRPDMQLDLGGVAKGYALDVVGALLREAGFSAFLVDGGGDLLLGEAPVGEAGWTVQVEGTTGLPVKRRNIAIVTSGDTYKFLDYEGVRYSHLIDPRTGLGTTNERQVTVAGAVAMVADGLASALCVAEDPSMLSYYPEYNVMMMAR
ncbi:FAD:protein FMN transferase [Neolewinella persica]|uniref:FAD:protein FMN transferase n=1 Tax=Neolewinella persica TaxID=70998 RepID=UPI00035F9DB8|nr:FAD:protein FMN transferase [Neolewinella persica]